MKKVRAAPGVQKERFLSIFIDFGTTLGSQKLTKIEKTRKKTSPENVSKKDDFPGAETSGPRSDLSGNRARHGDKSLCIYERIGLVLLN